jgi:hypothetical protein
MDIFFSVFHVLVALSPELSLCELGVTLQPDELWQASYMTHRVNEIRILY